MVDDQSHPLNVLVQSGIGSCGEGVALSGVLGTPDLDRRDIPQTRTVTRGHEDASSNKNFESESGNGSDGH